MASTVTTRPGGRRTRPARIAETGALRQGWASERAEARAARRTGDPAAEWRHLERSEAEEALR